MAHYVDASIHGSDVPVAETLVDLLLDCAERGANATKHGFSWLDEDGRITRCVALSIEQGRSANVAHFSSS
jgi:hypothetical protein